MRGLLYELTYEIMGNEKSIICHSKAEEPGKVSGVIQF
jgi:hypothetical protein